LLEKEEFPVKETSKEEGYPCGREGFHSPPDVARVLRYKKKGAENIYEKGPIPEEEGLCLFIGSTEKEVIKLAPLQGIFETSTCDV